jgi:carbamoyl-phosphate synthase small subunit
MNHNDDLAAHEPAVLLLADGTRFEGKSIGAVGLTSGEIAFNTGMYGYQEIFTDPSYAGQVLVMATPHIGNYGIHQQDQQSSGSKIAGLVVKNFSEKGSRVGGNGDLQAMLERDGVVGISGIDTRGLIQHIREQGAMNALICSDGTADDVLAERLAAVPSMEGMELSSSVTCEVATESGPEDGVRVALLDLGTKTNIAACLVERGARVKIFPMAATLKEMQAFDPQGWMISNGPGDPSAMPDTCELIDEIIELGQPVFGICLGHQLIALSQKLETNKMFNGHRGVNHPVKDLLTGRCEVTSQNHGFVVSSEAVDARDDIEQTHVHLNDGTVAGIRLKDRPVFSVQFHPEASAGPHDSRHLFDQFIQNIRVAESVSHAIH